MKSLLALFALLIAPALNASTRIKELASVEGVRDNQLIGYGLVVGLAGTGDRRQTVFSAQSLSNMLAAPLRPIRHAHRCHGRVGGRCLKLAGRTASAHAA